MKKLNLKSISAVICGMAIIAAAGSSIGQDKAGAEATLQGTDGREYGTVNFTEGPHGLLVKADLKDLPPGTHAFHLHAAGVCSPDFKAAGGHYNPTDKKHGFMSADGPHLGDMPNIYVPDSGKLQFEIFLPDIAVREGSAALLDADGTAVLIHKDPDDHKTDPAGAAGDRIACGVVKAK